MTSRARLTVAIAGLVTLVFALLLHAPLASLEEGVTDVRYAVRGERMADTNIAVVYIDDEAIRVMGWPVRRNFHALMLRALTDLRVRVVGLELLLEDQRVEYPEYDELLAGVIRTSVPVVLTAYLDSLGVREAQVPAGPDTFAALSYPGVAAPPLAGGGMHLPLPAFRDAAAGIGHVNFHGRGHLPVFAGYGAGVLPAFAIELARVSAGVPRAGVQSDGERVTMRNRDAAVAFRHGSAGEVALQYPGSIRSFTAWRFLDVLRAYDDERSGLPAGIPVLRLQDKIVLIGVIADGRGVVVDTPVDPRLPSIVVHATALDNAFHDRFLTHVPSWLVALLSVLLAVAAGHAVLFLPSPWDKLSPVVLAVILIAVSLAVFALWSTVLPLVMPLIVSAVVTVTGIVVRHRVEKGAMDRLTAEKNAVTAALRDREARLAVLERELLDYQAARAPDRTQELMEEIRKHKAEIRALSSRADDMEEFTPPGGDDDAAVFEGIMYRRSGPMRAVVDLVGKIAASDAPVLILGESGTGKELVARAIHRLSPRSTHAFVAVNCGALSESVLESELFGHEKGAFTGAVKDRIGRFELADGGTIFLDEIGEVSEGFQLKLLRVLQEGELERVGGSQTIRVHVRVVAATNKDLRELVRQKRYREDLYYRLNVLTVALPPLRERPDDIPMLIEHFLTKEQDGLRVSRNVMEALQQHTWPGNVRELESVIRRGAVLCRSESRGLIHMRDLPEDLAEAVRKSVPVQEQILDMVREAGFSRSAVTDTAAGLGGLNRGTVAEYLRGEFLRTFAEHQFDLEKAVQHIALTADPAVTDRVRRRYREYLGNIAEGIDLSLPWEEARVRLKSKTKNLPQRYHASLEQIAEGYFRRIWTLPPTA